MVVTLDKVKLGLGCYIDKEVIDKMTGLSKWVVGASMIGMPKLIDSKYTEYKPMLMDMEIASDDDHIDVDRLEDMLVKVATKYGKVSQSLGGAVITFDTSDISRAAQHIRQV